jgi:hypothetical protein
MKHYNYIGNIKGTNLNKGRARTWIEKSSTILAPYGFHKGMKIDIAFHDHSIKVSVNHEGKRKVAGRVKGEKTICILDICYPVEQREAMFKGSPELQIWARMGELVICAPNIPAI